ncbi:TetR family transcriptional regulator [Sphingobium sp. TA15]|uniref:TetR-family transcriptional regulator n=1 Tax=Sphingobium indicum (strain DSM 16413 / CCM 7287 / MTCC 6362 / UT26 / NBRC 101211 / UT26S) TaxID=452662 RepID=D4Z0V7_SPHIU|nr:TetR/AcrR family transcriptional regulator [Sphingobium indicum]BAI96239.1 TetR-family transcriptional regulator [Sphingobium indicum UT26S]BDD65540.1 TetR family transcriptional regulator [Sphingobium sp. TA15]
MVAKWRNAFRTNEELHRFKRYAVLREATRTISRRGFHNTSLDEIAEGLGISKGTLYNYVKDKQEILFDCHMIALDLGDRACEVAKEYDGSGLDKLRILLLCYIGWMYGEDGIGGVTSDVNALRLEDREVVVKRRDRLDREMVSLVVGGQSDGSIISTDPHLAIFVIMGAINSIATWYAPDGRMAINQIAEEVVAMLTRSLATDVSAHNAAFAIPPHPEVSLAFTAPVGSRKGVAPRSAKKSPRAESNPKKAATSKGQRKV